MREWKKAEQSNFGGKNPPGAWAVLASEPPKNVALSPYNEG